MNNLSIAFKNLKKNFAFYALYILSVSLVITIYFAFTSFSMNTVMLEKISGDGRVESMCRVISVFLTVFVIFYMSYSNRFFLRRRTKELGIYALLGYRRENILSLLLSENIIIGACFPSENNKIIIEDLTSMEKKILQLISDEKKRKCVADELYISERTLSNHLQPIFEKLDISTVVEAITKAIKLGYIPPVR